MAKTMKEIADAAERRWAEKGYTEGQKRARRALRKYVIHPEGKPPRTFVNGDSIAARRLEVDHAIDELREQRSQREVWDE